MKKIYLYPLITLFITLSACNDDFLERYPLDALSDQGFWKKEADLATYANRFYPSLPGAFARDLDNQSDNKVPQSPNSFLFDEYIVPTSGGGWSSNDWAQIRACNYFLQRYHTVTGNQNLIDAYVGEVRFFRAWEYFNKIKRFGDVPWLSTDLNASDTEVLYKARDPRNVVVDSVLADLDYAIEHLYPKGEALPDRLHADAARAFKARVCLFEASFRKYHGLTGYETLFEEAKNTAFDLINSGRYGLYSTGNPDKDYYNLFIQEDYADNSEAIFYRSYIKDIQTHNNTRQMTESATGFSKDMVESYLCKDGLPIAESGLYLGDDSLTMELTDRDPRLLQTIDNKTLPFQLDASGNPTYNDLPVIDPNRCTTGYFVMKFHSPDEAQWNANQSTLDWLIFRYAEVLLIYAEASAELGQATQVVLDESVNLLRERVGVAPLSVSVGFTDPNWPDYGYAVSPLLHEIRRERRVELAAEGFRWDDLVRWKAGKLTENLKTLYGMKIHPDLEGQYGSRLDNITLTADRLIQVYPGRDQRVWNDRLYLYPLPSEELVLNTNLTQNPGWE
ncbi:RagB/SusD family nutrient uptake outer membrane protein [Rapidithrix thailandica]|uniref:RagB/SusD family nutrient uptake outer membrane protein n=1 Tax=Rapidithrix thailandica TaxID=413964 RepID=A0AAW9RXK7_9BACT